MLTCPHCEKPFARKAYGPEPTYCSTLCRVGASKARAQADGRDKQWAANAKARRDAELAAQAKPCPYCGDLMTNLRRVQCGKEECARQRVNERNRNWQRNYKAEHGEYYARHIHGERQLSGARELREQRRAAGIPVGRQRHREAYRKADAARRARKAQAPTIEDFAPREIFDRDQWHCGVCQDHVDAGLKWPHPMSATLDHVVPLSKGGDHTRANCRLAHARCNLSRGNRGGGEQLLLIG